MKRTDSNFIVCPGFYQRDASIAGDRVQCALELPVPDPRFQYPEEVERGREQGTDAKHTSAVWHINLWEDDDAEV